MRNLREFYRDKFDSFLRLHAIEQTTLGDTCRLVSMEILDAKLFMPKTMRDYLTYLQDVNQEETYEIDEFIAEYNEYLKF